jgi:sensor histidine kinase YesM
MDIGGLHMTFDIATLYIVVGIVNFMACMLMIVFWRIHKMVKGPALWAASASVSFIGFILMQTWDDSYRIFLNNCGTLIGALLLMEGILRFRNIGNEPKRLKYIIFFMILSVVMAYINQYNPTARYIYHDFIVVAVSIISALAMLYKTTKLQFFVHMYTALAFVIIIPVFSYRWFLAVSGQLETSLVGPSQHFFVGILFLSVIPHIIGWSLGLSLAITYQMRQEIEDAMEAKWLQAQIQPHFIFNTLNSINALSTIDIKKMRRLVEAFSDFLRSKFDYHSFSRWVSVDEEIDIVNSYLYIQKVRYSDKLTIQIDRKDSDVFHLPTLTIQPIVENAIKHGIMKQANGGTISIKTIQKGEYLRVIIKDNGVGIEASNLQSILQMNKDETRGVGLINTNKRLKQGFGDGLRIKSKVGVGTIVSFTITKKFV